MSKIGILGTGTWGIALARTLTNAGHEVTAWSPHSTAELAAARRHKNLPDMVIPDATCFTDSIEEVCTGKELLLMAVASVYVRSVTAQAAPFIRPGQIIVDAAKGIEEGTLLTMTEVIHSELAKAGKAEGVSLVAFSGPTHAEEVSRDLPTTVVAAGEDPAAMEKVQEIFLNTCMRVYTNTDVRGVELCGAVKNIVALASGISTGLGYGDNTKAALVTRGMEEIKRLGLAMGCREKTFFGLAGIGDLVVTTTSRHSRNNRCGELIGQGYSVEDAVKEVGMVVEGINALPAAMELSGRYGVEMPITEAVYNIIFRGTSPQDAVIGLMARDMKAES